MNEGFKRINFFNGFFTKAEDWKSAQDYHLEKRRIHNSHLHTPGIVSGCLHDLKVTATSEGDSLYVAPGYAIDGEGRDLYLPNPETLRINAAEHNPPSTIYVIIRYGEERIDKREKAGTPGSTDFAFIKEYPIVEVTEKQPDNLTVIELARISLSKESARIRNAADSHNPGSNEVDIGRRITAGSVKGRTHLDDIGTIVKEGEIGVAASDEPVPSEADTNVLIEKIKGKDAHRFYLVSTYPVEEARIMWRIESIFTKSAVEYRLFFQNLSKKSAKVHYRVYSLT